MRTLRKITFYNKYYMILVTIARNRYFFIASQENNNIK